MLNRRFVFGLVVLLAMFGLIMTATPSNAKAPCPWTDIIQCPQIYDPVTCDGGVVYPNACEEFRNCATGCGAPGS